LPAGGSGVKLLLLTTDSQSHYFSSKALTTYSGLRLPFAIGIDSNFTTAGHFYQPLPKEVIMAIKVLIKRRFKEGYFKEIEKMIKMVRYGAMDQKGYISSETLWDHEDPFRVVIASTWREKKYWAIWKNDPARIAKEKEFESFLDGETEYELYDLGMYPH
jgi:heme-degrading monooxygenase HmoA